MRALASALAPVHQHYLLEARQMQALSFAAHIPLVAFAISFPAMVLFVEWLWLRTGDDLFRTIAQRWARVMAAVIAVGGSTGTSLSFATRLPPPNVTATSWGGFGPCIAVSGAAIASTDTFTGI